MVGQSFVKLLLSHSTDLYNEYGIKPKIVACADHGGIITCNQGLDLERLLNLKKKKKSIEVVDLRVWSELERGGGGLRRVDPYPP